mgnify:CR=1 FL=1
MRKIITITTAIFMVLVAFSSVSIIGADDNYDTMATIYVDDDADPSWYDATHVKTVQEGIDNATSGDTVWVYNGTYNESVFVDKSIDVTGENRDVVTINGNIQIWYDNVNFSGFTINMLTNDKGIYIGSNDTINISNNNIIGDGVDPGHGIYIGEFFASGGGDNVTVYNNNISDTYYCAIYMSPGSVGNIYKNNKLENTGSFGIFIDDSRSVSNLLIDGNTINNTGNEACLFAQTIGVVFSNNTVSNGLYGVHINNADNIDVINNAFSSMSSSGVYAENDCFSIDVLNNTITDSDNLVYISGNSNNGTIAFNDVSECAYSGLRFDYADNFYIYENEIYNCGERGGIWFAQGSDNNYIYRNTLYNNDINTEDENSGTNQWYSSPNSEYTGGSSYLGNYYDDYTGIDADGDGVGDTNYTVDSSYSVIDQYPLISKYPFDATFNVNSILLNVTFNATSYSYYGNSITNYTWDLGDGTYRYISDFTHTYSTMDSYDVTLTVTDSGGNTSSFTETILGTVMNKDTNEYFTTIQDAIDDAETLDGHTIYVSDGTYSETVTVNKELTVEGQSTENTIIDGSNGVWIATSNITFRNFTIRNVDDAGMWIMNTPARENVNVSNCEIYNAGRGIHFDMFSQPNKYSISIYNNTIHDISGNGVWVLRVNNVTFDSNTVYDCSKGFYIEGRADDDSSWTCRDIVVKDNELYDNSDVIWVTDSSYVTVDNNNIYQTLTGYNLNGITTYSGCDQIDITNNDVSGCAWGLWDAGPNTNITCSDNYIYNNSGYGINPTSSSDGVLFENNLLVNNKIGIYPNGGNNHIFRYNAIINTEPAHYRGYSPVYVGDSSTGSTWEYNYFGDYTGIDSNNDGYGGTVYTFEGGQDSTPLIGIYPFGACYQYSLNGLQITLNATSYDYNGAGITNYTWHLGDGTNAYTEDVSHTYSSAGLYTVTLTVQNSTTTDTFEDEIFVGTPPSTMYVDDDYNDGTGGWKYSHWDSIMDATFYTPEGATVNVASGTYEEDVYIYNKSINLFGEDKNTTVIDSKGERDYGLDNDMLGSTLYLNGLIDSEISGLNLTNASSGNNRACLVFLDRNDGLSMYRLHEGQPRNVSIHDNIISDAVSHNVLVGYMRGCHFYNNIVCDGDGYGIGLWRNSACDDARIYNNTVYNVQTGITTYEENYIVYGNEIYNCQVGIYAPSTDSEFYNNYVHDCYGDGAQPSGGVFHRNKFVNNSANVRGYGTFMGGNPTIGNYYDDYTGVDSNGDGIGDTSYDTDEDQDYRPLMNPYNGTDLVDAPIYNSNKGTYDVSFQTAIDNADVGDIIQTTWYDYMNQGDSIFGEEEITIDKQLSLTSSDRDNIVLDGGVTISADDTSLENFTITGAGMASGFSSVTASNYCGGGGTDGYFIISNVEIADLSKASGNDGGYADYTSSVANVNGGQTYDINITVKDMLDGGYPIYVKVFIDSDADEELTDETGYEIGSTNTDSSGTTLSSTITIPTTVSGKTLMRVMVKYGGYPSPCESLSYGEVEDYTIDITPAEYPAGITVNANDVELTRCNITNNYYGVKCTGSGIKAYYNNFVGNTDYLDAGDSIYRYNYWDSYDSAGEGAYDNDSNGIVDIDYNVPGGDNKDRALMTPSDGTVSYPVIFNNATSSLTFNSVILNGFLEEALGTSREVWFEYGADTNYGTTTTPQTISEGTGFNAELTGLTPGEEYHYRAIVNGSEYGALDDTFTMEGPVLIDVRNPTDNSNYVDIKKGTMLNVSTFVDPNGIWIDTVSTYEVDFTGSLLDALDANPGDNYQNVTFGDLFDSTTFQLGGVINNTAGTITEIVWGNGDTNTSGTMYYMHFDTNEGTGYAYINLTYDEVGVAKDMSGDLPFDLTNCTVFIHYYEPSEPSPFTATTYSQSEIDLSWTKDVVYEGPSDGLADTTYIERNTVSSWSRGDGTEIYNDSGISFRDSGLSQQVTYYYQAWSYNATDNLFSPLFATANDTTSELAPPSDLVVVATDNSYGYKELDLSWVKADQAHYTYVERNTAPVWSRGAGTMVYNDTGTWFTDTGLDSHSTYYYQAWSYNISLDDAVTPWSNSYSDNYNTTLNNAPEAPVNPGPADNAPYESVYNCVLNATVYDLDLPSETFSVEFWFDGSLVHTATSVANDSSTSYDLTQYIDPDWLNHDSTYTWYIKVNDTVDITTSATWSFNTSHYSDVNEDGIVNYLDVSALSSVYRTTCTPGSIGSDLNNDGEITYLDVSGLVSDYYNTYP